MRANRLGDAAAGGCSGRRIILNPKRKEHFLIEITRNLARQLRMVFRQTLGLTGRGLSPPVVFQTGSDGLLVQIWDRGAAVEYRQPGDLAPQRIVVPFELLAACEGRRQEPVKLESEGKNRIVVSWRDGIRHSHAPLPPSTFVTLPLLLCPYVPLPLRLFCQRLSR